MADYDIYREQLAILYPSYGHALWEPSPTIADRPVQVGDVGFIRRGNFHRLFNALLPADDPSHERGVPGGHEPLVPALPDHLDTGFLSQNDYCSAGVSVEPDPGYHSSGLDNFPNVSFQSRRTRAAVLSLPVTARREDTLAQDDFKWWIVKHIDSWFAFAGKLGLGIEQMEEIILVTGCHRTRSWANVAFLGNQVDAQVTNGVKAEGPDVRVKFRFSPGNARGAVLRLGPQGTNLPENQCLFIRGFRVARSLPKRPKAAPSPSPDPGGCSGTGVISIPAITKQDPLHVLLEYIAERASDCDMVLTHDDDLVTINGVGYDALESLEPEVMMDLLRRSNVEIDKVLCDLPSNDSGPNADTHVVKVAMVSVKLQTLNSNIGSQSQRSLLAGQNTIQGDRSKREIDRDDGALPASQDLANSTLHTLSHGTNSKDIFSALGRTRNSPPNVWASLSKSAHVKRDRLLMTGVTVVACCAVSLVGWVFSFTWDVKFKVLFSLLLSSFPLSVWFELEYPYRRWRDDVSGWAESLQLHVVRPAVNSSEDPKQRHAELEAPGDSKRIHAELEAAGVPLSFADCRTCPDPCEDGHEEYPPKIVSRIDTTSDMLGSVKPYRRQVVISTGMDNWERNITEEKGSLASYISDIEKAGPLTTVSASDVRDTSTSMPVAGIFKDSENHAVGILNGSHDTLSRNHDHETVLVLPDYKVLTEVPRSLDGARELWRNSVNPSVSRLGSTSESSSVKSWVIPYTCVILICSHAERDVRCAAAAPILEDAFTQTLEREGWDVHTQLEDPTGSPLDDYRDEDKREAEFTRRLQELNKALPKRALVLKTSHVTRHEYAGNVIIYMPQGAGVWYGRVSTHEVASIVHATILGGRILPPLLRGGVNLARPDCKRLNDW